MTLRIPETSPDRRWTHSQGVHTEGGVSTGPSATVLDQQDIVHATQTSAALADHLVTDELTQAHDRLPESWR